MNAGNSQWSGCADAPYFYLAGDIEKSSEKLFPKILAANVPVLLYNGKPITRFNPNLPIESRSSFVQISY
jgi:hypothetical protein